MKYVRAQKVSIFRKAAFSLWGSGGDPSVYGFIELDLTNRKLSSSPLPLVIKALSEVMKNHKDLNSILRFGQLYHRKNIDVSVLVNIPDIKKHDLSFATLQNVDNMSLDDIESKLTAGAKLIRAGKDPQLGFALRLIYSLPWFMTGLFLKAYSFFAHDLSMDLSSLRLPARPFGSVIVTNVGSLGIKKALVPLVPMSRAIALLSVGEVGKEARVIDDSIVIRKILHLGVTFDHRFFDGSHAAGMIADFEKSFYSLVQNEVKEGLSQEVQV